MKYFTKYLPVEGEIKEGDRVIHPDGEVRKCIEIIKKDIKENDLIVMTENSGHYRDKCKKVKLFLCSRDIKVGDKVKVDVLDNGKLNDFTFKNIDIDEGLPVWEFEGVGLFNYFPGYDEELPPFKVIGEISPDAIWVKEGDEFDEEEIERLDRANGRKYTKEQYESLVKLTGHPKEPVFVQIKCPTCKTYH